MLSISTESSISEPSIEKSTEDVEQPANNPPEIEDIIEEVQSEWTLRACLNLLGAFCIFFLSIGFINAYGVFQTYYAMHQLSSKSQSSISWLGSFNVFCLFSGTLLTGPLQDKYGPRIIVLIGSILTIFAMFMVSLCKQYYQFFLAQALLLGFGISFLFTPGVAVIAIYFTRNRGLALGIAVSGSSLGGVIWPIALQRLFATLSFGWTVRIAAFIMFALSSIACITICPPPRHYLSPTITISSSSSSSKPAAAPSHKLDFTIARNRILQLLAASLFFVYLGLFSPFFYITPYSLSHGLSNDMSFYMISIINASSLFGRLLPGFLADRFGRYNILILAVASSAVILFCWTRATGMAGIVVWSLGYGLASGAVISIQSACAAAVVMPHQYGTAIGLVMGVLSIAGLIGTPINGRLLATRDGFFAVSLFSGACMMVGAVGLVIARLKLGEGRGLWVVL